MILDPRPMKVGFFLFILTWILYIRSFPYTVLGGDNGDFLTAIITHGIAHPSGYPTFVILGILVSYLPISIPVIYKVGLLTSLFASLTVLLFFYLSIRQSKSTLIATITSLTLAFAYPFWLYAVSAEVFSLHYLLVVILIYVSYLYSIKQTKTLLYVLIFFIGLSLTNNLTILLVFPTVLILIAKKKIPKFITLRVILTCTAIFIVSLLPYLYLLYGSKNDQVMGWPKVDDAVSLFHYAMRRGYGWGIVAQQTIKTEIRTLSLLSFGTYWAFSVSPLFFLVSLIGAPSLLRKNKRFFLALFTGFFTTGFLFILYSGIQLSNKFQIGQMERFYMVPFIFILPFFTQGLVSLQEIFLRILKPVYSRFKMQVNLRWLVIFPFLFVPFSLLILNFPRTYLKTMRVGEYFARDILQGIPNNSIILLITDNAAFNTEYLQASSGYRKDVMIGTSRSIRNLVSNDPDYVNEKKRILSKKPSLTEVDTVLSVLFALNKKRPVFAEARIGRGLVDFENDWIPYGLHYRLRKKGENLTKDEFLKQQRRLFSSYHISDVRDALTAENTLFYTMDLAQIYRQALTRVGVYLFQHYNSPKDALEFFNLALSLGKSDEVLLESTVNVYIATGNCERATENMVLLKQIEPKKAMVYQVIIDKVGICKKNR